MALWNGRFVNTDLIREPLNWSIVFVIGTIALLGFHTVMQAFGAMSAPQGAIGAGPGQVNMSPDWTGVFSTAGNLSGNPDSGTNLSPWLSATLVGDGTWTDPTVARYAEDGWTGNS